MVQPCRSASCPCRESWELDAVEHPAEHAGGVGDGFLASDVRALRAEVGGVRSLVVGGDVERAAGAGGALLEDQRDVPARQPEPLGAFGLGALELGGAGDQRQNCALSRSSSLSREPGWRMAVMGEILRWQADGSSQAVRLNGAGHAAGPASPAA